MSDGNGKLVGALRSGLLDKIEWRPVSITPAEGQISLVGAPGRTAAAVFRSGEWTTEKGKPLKFVPTHYMVFKDA